LPPAFDLEAGGMTLSSQRAIALAERRLRTIAMVGANGP
jgi:hypothetical protein